MKSGECIKVQNIDYLAYTAGMIDKIRFVVSHSLWKGGSLINPTHKCGVNQAALFSAANSLPETTEALATVMG